MPKNFFIAFFERSGSTMLVDLLKQHKQIDCRMELFYTKDILEDNKFVQVPMVEKKDIQNKLSFFKERKLFGKNKVKGFKFKFPNQFEMYPGVFNYLIENDLKCIFLVRQNMLKAAVSRQYHSVLRDKVGVSNVKEPINLGNLNLHMTGALNYMQLRQNQTNEYGKLLEEKFSSVQTIYYEDLLYRKVQTLKKIFNFLEVKQMEIETSSFVKIVNNDLKKAIQNYNWAFGLLERTVYAPFFFKDNRTEADIAATRQKQIEFYEKLDIQLHPASKKNTYHHKLQKPLGLTDKEVTIFRKLQRYYENIRIGNGKNAQSQLLKRIKQFEIQLFLGKKYRLKTDFDKNRLAKKNA